MSDSERKIARAMAGDEDALMELLQDHHAMLREQIATLIPPSLRPLLDEDDILQDTYTEVFLDISSFTLGASFAAWLFTIARHNLLDAIRCHKTSKRGGKQGYPMLPHFGTATHYTSSLDSLPGSDKNPSDEAMQKETRAGVKELVNLLPQSYRDVLIAYDIQGVEAADAAAMLKCSQGALYMRRLRALRKLRKMLEIPSDSSNNVAAVQTALSVCLFPKKY